MSLLRRLNLSGHIFWLRFAYIAAWVWLALSVILIGVGVWVVTAAFDFLSPVSTYLHMQTNGFKTGLIFIIVLPNAVNIALSIGLGVLFSSAVHDKKCEIKALAAAAEKKTSAVPETASPQTEIATSGK